MPIRPPLSILMCLLAMLLFSSHVALGASLTTADGTNGADAYVQDGGNPNQSNVAQGTADSDRLRVRSDNGTFRKTYLRFDLASQNLTTAIDSSQAATLTLFADGDSDVNPVTVNLYGINDAAQGDALGDWAEAALTWDNSLATAQNVDNGTDVNAAGTQLLATLDLLANPQGNAARFTYSGGDEFVFSSTELADFLNADTNGLASFILTYDTGSGSTLGLASKETLTVAAPTLQFALTPEPASIAIWTLLGLLGMGFAYRLRRGK